MRRAPVRERLLMAGNQLGKTLAGGAGVGHASDRPLSRLVDGAAFDKPVRMWARARPARARATTCSAC